MGCNYQKQDQKEYKNLVSEVGDLKILLKNLTSTIGTLNDTINAMNIVNEKKDDEAKKLILEIERLKNKNNKNSLNFGKLSSKE